MNPKVDFYFDKAKQWKKELEKLRSVVLDCDLVEELKWGAPCYTYQRKNIVLIHVFNEYCALLFFKGALLKDPEGILVRQTENVQAARQIRFTSVADIVKREKAVKARIYEAVALEEAGAKVELRTTNDYPVPEEFHRMLAKMPKLRTAFDALTPGRQRGYLLYFSGARLAKTRESRIEKCVPQIMQGKGLND